MAPGNISSSLFVLVCASLTRASLPSSSLVIEPIEKFEEEEEAPDKERLCCCFVCFPERPVSADLPVVISLSFYF